MSKPKFETRCFKAGEIIFRQGGRAAEAYLIEEGEVMFFRWDGDEEVEIGRLGPRWIFGELAILTDMPRVATAVAVTDLYCYALPREELRHLVEHASVHGEALIRTLSHFNLDACQLPDEDGDAVFGGLRKKDEMLVRRLLQTGEIERMASGSEPVLRQLMRGLAAYAKANLAVQN